MHLVTADGISTDEDKIRAAKDWPCPQNPQELRSFLDHAHITHALCLILLAWLQACISFQEIKSISVGAIGQAEADKRVLISTLGKH